MAVVVVAVVAALTIGSRHDARAGGTQGTQGESGGPATTQAPLVPDPTAPVDVQVTVKGGQAHVTWTAPDALKGDTYRVLRVDPGHTDTPFVQTTGDAATVRGIGSDRSPCFEVATVRDDQISDPSSPVCAT